MPSRKPNGSTPSRSLVSRRRCTSKAACHAASASPASKASSRPGSAKHITSRWGTPAPPPHCQRSGALAPWSPSRRIRLGSVIPPRNSGENPARTLGGTPRASSPDALKATCKRSRRRWLAELRAGHRRLAQPRPRRFPIAHPQQQVAGRAQVLVAEPHHPLEVAIVDGRSAHSSSAQVSACRPPSVAASRPRRTSVCRSRSTAVSPG